MFKFLRKRPDTYVVKAIFDEEARVWVATSKDIPGLVTEAETQAQLVEKLRVMIPEILEENRASIDPPRPDLPVSLLCEERLQLHVAV